MRKQCREYAKKFVDIQKQEFERLGVLGEWDNPYLTMNYSYEGITAHELARFAENGGLYKGKKPVHWCSSCGTALAEAEVEYADHKSPSVFVKFQLKDDISKELPALSGKKVSPVIWTTTPWTIPANLAIAMHPEFDYVALDTGAEVLIVAEGLKEAFFKATGVSGAVIDTFKAAALEKKLCRHPFYDRDSIILLGDHVTLEAGTGCVHTAPGHGQEDYELGLKFGLDIYNPVDNRGRFLETIPFFAGQYVFDANPNVIAKLEEVGALVGKGEISHSYPHCWRCKKPIIFRATEQWFISMESNDLRRKALTEINTVSWIPKWGKERIFGMIENRPDWCVSRQRNWGVPITVFYCKACGEAWPTVKSCTTWPTSSRRKAPTSGMSGRRKNCSPPAPPAQPAAKPNLTRKWISSMSGSIRASPMPPCSNTATICHPRPTCTWREATNIAAGSTPRSWPVSAPAALPPTKPFSPMASSSTAAAAR